MKTSNSSLIIIFLMEERERKTRMNTVPCFVCK